MEPRAPETSGSSRAQKHLGLCLGLIIGLMYLVVSYSFGNLYPFTTIPMVEGRWGFPAQRLILVDERGRSHLPSSFTAFRCPEDVDTAVRRCPAGEAGAHRIAYVDVETLETLRLRGGLRGPGMPVHLVRRTWTRDEGAPALRVSDCKITTCEALSR